MFLCIVQLNIWGKISTYLFLCRRAQTDLLMTVAADSVSVSDKSFHDMFISNLCFKHVSKCHLSHIFSDIDECRTLADPCRGDMRCVNQNGGYLCIPRGLYSQPYARNSPQSYPEETYPDASLGYPETFVPNPPPVGPGPGPSYPIVSRSAPCFLGYTAGDDGTCVGEFVPCAVGYV